MKDLSKSEQLAFHFEPFILTTANATTVHTLTLDKNSRYKLHSIRFKVLTANVVEVGVNFPDSEDFNFSMDVGTDKGYNADIGLISVGADEFILSFLDEKASKYIDYNSTIVFTTVDTAIHSVQIILGISKIIEKVEKQTTVIEDLNDLLIKENNQKIGLDEDNG